MKIASGSLPREFYCVFTVVSFNTIYFLCVLVRPVDNQHQ
jgi:hypothetical protein